MSPRKAAALRDGGRSLHDHLVAVAQSLLGRRSPRDITVRDIAREGRVAAGVLYNYFADKDELLAEALTAQIRDAMPVSWSGGDALDQLAGTGTVQENLERLLAAATDAYLRVLPLLVGLLSDPPLFQRLIAKFPHGDFPDGMHGPLTRYLQAERRAGRIAADADPPAAARLLLGGCHDLVMVHMISRHTAAPGTPEPLPSNMEQAVPGEEIRALVTAVLRGLMLRGLSSGGQDPPVPD